MIAIFFPATNVYASKKEQARVKFQMALTLDLTAADKAELAGDISR